MRPGVRAFIRKPFLMDQLSRVIKVIKEFLGEPYKTPGLLLHQERAGNIILTTGNSLPVPIGSYAQLVGQGFDPFHLAGNMQNVINSFLGSEASF